MVTSATEQIEISPVRKDVTKEYVELSENRLMIARQVVIATDQDYDYYGQGLVEIKSKIKYIEFERKKITDPIRSGLEAVMNLFRKPIDNLTEAQNIISKSMADYNRKKDEAIRIEQEAIRKAQETEAKKLQERAAKAEANGKLDKAEELKQQAELKQAIIPQVMAEKPKVAGLTEKEYWKATVVDINALLNHCLSTGDGLVVPDMKALDGIARTTKGTMKIPGVIFTSEKKIVGARTV